MVTLRYVQSLWTNEWLDDLPKVKLKTILIHAVSVTSCVGTIDLLSDIAYRNALELDTFFVCGLMIMDVSGKKEK